MFQGAPLHQGRRELVPDGDVFLEKGSDDVVGSECHRPDRDAGGHERLVVREGYLDPEVLVEVGEYACDTIAQCLPTLFQICCSMW